MAGIRTGEEIRDTQRTRGFATILGLGTASPPNIIYQDNYPDFYFRVINSEHKIELKDKFKRVCEKSMIRKRHVHLTEELLKENPNLTTYKAPSLDARQEILVKEVPKLGKEAAMRAIKEWGQPVSKITHLVFCSASGVEFPGADYQLVMLIGLRLDVNRVLLNNLGCYAGGTALRIAKDLAENNSGARVLVVCSENMAVSFHAPNEAHLDILVGQALFSDGASAAIVGADPDTSIESPLFEIVSAGQSIIPESQDAIVGHFREMGLSYYLSEKLPTFISENAETALIKAFRPIGISDWNSLFWILHPGGPAILNGIEEKLGLNQEKLEATRYVLKEYGNMWGACVIFILDVVRKFSLNDGKSTTGDGLEWGVLLAFGPGLTMETLVLRSVPLDASTD